MHELLELRGQLESKKRKGQIGPAQLPKDGVVTSDKIELLIDQMRNIKGYWEKDVYLSSVLISVYYNKIVAKTNRIKALFSTVNSPNPNDNVVGARFKNNKHVITYHLNKKDLDIILGNLCQLNKVLKECFNGIITSELLGMVNKGDINVESYGIKKSKFSNFVVDSFYVEKLGVDEKESIPGMGDIIVTLYDLKDELENVLDKVGINHLTARKIDNTTFLLSRKQYDSVIEKLPYLVAMELEDLKDFVSENLGELSPEDIYPMPLPSNEPFIGVIDTLFDKNVYFEKWVDCNNSYIDENIVSADDYIHGTEICSLIVNGHIMNKKLDDGCGYFRVRHFGVATHGRMSSYSVISRIEEIVKSNPDIIVWNLSLGSESEVNNNFISYEASVLDRLQHEYGVIFVISGTNNNDGTNTKKIGAPADSINALVVNSSKLDGTPASYSRSGPVLSFFNKPDVCYFGGDGSEAIRVCSSNNQEKFQRGTSYAAPWISRKMAYLIHKLHMPREIAKALIIDSSTSWNETTDDPTISGYGKVPQHIEDIIYTRKDEIKFYIYGFAEKYDTYTYRIPVPISKEKHPFISRATMCYFPQCSRNQGVDYTNIELDLHFGKIRNTKKGQEIYSINDNKQGIPEMYGGNEEQARKEYRKWDNVKHICEREKSRKVAKDIMGEGLWGLSIKKVSRLSTTNEEKIPFGVVVTLKDIYGDDHFEEFIQKCNFKGWIVNRINVEEKIALYDKIEEEIELD